MSRATSITDENADDTGDDNLPAVCYQTELIHAEAADPAARGVILLADSHPAMLEGMAAILRPRYRIGGAVRDGHAIIEAAARIRPDMIILEIMMPLVNGLEAAAHIRADLPHVKLLYFTTEVRPAYLECAQRVGAAGLVLKSATPAELLTAVETVFTGGIAWPSRISTDGTNEIFNLGMNALSSCLTLRELEVLRMIANGCSVKEIAHRLNISVWTVTFHRRQIKRKLGVDNTAELTRYAIEEGLV